MLASLFAGQTGSAKDLVSEYIVLVNAEYSHSQSTEIPTVFESTRSLPDFWNRDQRYSQGAYGWYRFSVPNRPEKLPWSVLLVKFTQNVEVFFNGHWIGTSGSMVSPMPINFNRPFVFHLPEILWQDKNNVLDVRLATMPAWGVLAPIAIGPTGAVQKAYGLRYFTQITVNQISLWLTMLVSLIALVYWWSDRSESKYGWFALTSALWSISAANYFTTEFPVSVEMWSVVFHTSIDMFSIALVIFIYRLLGIKMRKFELVLLFLICAAAITYFILRILLQEPVTMLFHLLFLLVGVYVAGVLLVRVIRAPGLNNISCFSTFAIFFCIMVHDTLLARGIAAEAWYGQFYLVQLTTPILLGLLLLLISNEFVGALRLARSANEQLGLRMHEISQKLEHSYNARRQAENEQAAALEREQIYRDLHDDVGARLLSLIYLADSKEQEEVARGALNDIRGLVQANIEDSVPLLDLVAQWRSELSHRCEESGFELDWQVGEIGGSIPPNMNYHLTRIVRELTTNTFQHSEGTKITVSISLDQNLILMFKDNGRGFSMARQRSGRGIANVQRRVERLSGAVEWTNLNPGCQVVIKILFGEVGG